MTREQIINRLFPTFSIQVAAVLADTLLAMMPQPLYDLRHYRHEPYKVACGADDQVQQSTQNRDTVTCQACLAWMRKPVVPPPSLPPGYVVPAGYEWTGEVRLPKKGEVRRKAAKQVKAACVKLARARGHNDLAADMEAVK